MVITQLNNTNTTDTPDELRPGKTIENLSYLTIRTSNVACYARFYPALYQLTLVKHGVEEKVDLGFSGSRLLERLVRDPGEVIDRDELISHAWSGRVVGQGSLNQQIYTLRQILCDESTREIIQTLPRRGYLINPSYVDLPIETPAMIDSASPESDLVTDSNETSARASVASIKSAKKRWILPAVVGFSSLSVLGAAFNYQESAKTSTFAGKGNLLTVTYAPTHPAELASLVQHGENIKRRLSAKISAPLQLVVGLHEKTLNVVCLHSDGSARSLHFSENQQEQLTVTDFSSCLP
jgi:cholera toxin transcriptional activator